MEEAKKLNMNLIGWKKIKKQKKNIKQLANEWNGRSK